MENGACKTRLCAGAMGLSVGITWAFTVILCSILAGNFNYGSEWVKLLSSFYLGYDTTVKGIAIGGVWGFVDGFIFGFLIAFFYNFVCKRCPCKICCSKKE